MNRFILAAISVIAFGTPAFAQGSSSTSVESNTNAGGTSSTATHHNVQSTPYGGVASQSSQKSIQQDAITGETAVHKSNDTSVDNGILGGAAASHSESTTVTP